MSENEFGVIYAGKYDSIDAMVDARADFELLQELHKRKWIGTYESALFTKNDDGSVKILDTDAPGRPRGAKWGAAIGAAVGLIFPVSILAGAIVGGGAGLLGGHLSRGLKRTDIKDLGELLDEGEAGIVLVGIVTREERLDLFLKRATKVLKKRVDADVEELKKVIEEAAKG